VLYSRPVNARAPHEEDRTIMTIVAAFRVKGAMAPAA
jgi:hypothetical protein